MTNVIPTRVRPGIIFTPGDYSDKGIGIVTEADMDAIAAASNEAVLVKDNHNHGFFDGMLGRVFNFRVAPNSKGIKVVWGDWEEPEPLAQFLGDTKRQISAGFADWATRKISEISLTPWPRVADACFFNGLKVAFSDYQAGQPVKQYAFYADPVDFNYRTAAERDAIPLEDLADPVNKLFPIRTQDELDDAMRQIWHAADPTGVKNNIIAIAARKKFTVNSYYPYSERGMSKAIPEPAATSTGYEYDDEDYRFSASGAGSLDKPGSSAYNNNNPEENSLMSTPAGGTAAEAKPEEITPTMWERFKARMGWSDEQLATAKADFSANKSPREIALEQEIARRDQAEADRKAEEFSSRAGQRAATAKSMVEALIKDLRILPADAEAVTAEFTRALDDDAQTPRTVTFSVETENGQGATNVAMSRAQSLEAHYRLRPKHNLTDEVIPEFAAETYAAFSKEVTQPRGAQSAEFNATERRELLSHTEAGRRILAAEDAAAAAR